MPRHIAIIMDGNGRWAKRHGLPRIAGHRRGVEAVREIVRCCGERRIPYLTLFAFSSENWRRPATEVRLLIDLFRTTLQSELRKLDDNGVRLRVIGDLSRFPAATRKLVQHAEIRTSANEELRLTIAFNYGGRWDITEACRRIAERVAAGELRPDEVTADLLDTLISTHGVPDPDLFIRTGGEKRVSNFLLWQLAYSEFHFTDTLWPDFDEQALVSAIEDFAGRQRRFGQTSEQIARQRA